jgi:hypothetical protein
MAESRYRRCPSLVKSISFVEVSTVRKFCVNRLERRTYLQVPRVKVLAKQTDIR